MLLLDNPIVGNWNKFKYQWEEMYSSFFDVGLTFKNGYDKTIKYIYFSVVAFNQVDDPLNCAKLNNQVARLKFTGPLEPDDISTNNVWENVFNNYSVSYCKIIKIEIIFMDETTKIINESNIEYDELIGKTSSQGCYIATCVYGSYNCKEVYVLRRFRDQYLSKKYLGRLFIKIYYKYSPKIVKKYGKENWFIKICRNNLDRFVLKLRKKGYLDTTYND